MTANISKEAREFEADIVEVLKKHADKLDHAQAYEALVVTMPKFMTGVIVHLRRGNTDDEVRKIFVQVVDQIITDIDSGNGGSSSNFKDKLINKLIKLGIKIAAVGATILSFITS